MKSLFGILARCGCTAYKNNPTNLHFALMVLGAEVKVCSILCLYQLSVIDFSLGRDDTDRKGLVQSVSIGFKQLGQLRND
jgi:hypothetical protein